MFSNSSSGYRQTNEYPNYQNGNHFNYSTSGGDYNGYNGGYQHQISPQHCQRPQYSNYQPYYQNNYQQYQPNYQNNYVQRNYSNMNSYTNGQFGNSGLHGDYAVQKWNSMNSFSNMKAVDYSQVTNLIQVVKNFYTECPSVTNRSTEEVIKWRTEHKVRVMGNVNLKPILSFSEAGIPKFLMLIIQKQRYEIPTVIQSQAWPIALSGVDMIGIARTGSGKTLAFCLPAIIHIMAQPDLRQGDGPIALILSPTRELAKQVEEVARLFGKCCGVNSVAVYGGADKNSQISQLNKGAHVVVACPGRLLDLINQKKLNLHRTTYLVMDEADRMLDMGFEPQIRKVVGQIRKDRQTLMFSATWPTSVQKLAHDFMNDPTQIYIGNQGLAANSNIKQIVEVIHEAEKQSKFMMFFKEATQRGQKILVFTDTKRECDNLAYTLNKLRHRTCSAIHGDKDQRERERVLNDFRSGRVSTLIATDVAARGLDIDDVGFVINYDFPHTVEDYVHRIGRTGRANACGTAYSLITEKHAKCVPDLIKVLEGSGNAVPEDLLKLKPHQRRNGFNSRGRSNRGANNQRPRNVPKPSFNNENQERNKNNRQKNGVRGSHTSQNINRQTNATLPRENQNNIRSRVPPPQANGYMNGNMPTYNPSNFQPWDGPPNFSNLKI